MIYFDSAATTIPTKEIIELHQYISTKYWYNSNSRHKGGIMCNQLLQKAINIIKGSLLVTNKKVIFTNSATTANNLAIYGICNNYLGQNKHIITTMIEHPSVLNCFKDLETKGFRVTYLRVNEEGFIDINELANAINSDTILVSIMWVNNIIGSIQPIKDVINLIKKYPRVRFFMDGVGGIGKLKNDFSFNDIDLFTYTAHKLNGLKGTGVLICNDNINLISNVKGGHQQDGDFPGTIDLAGAVCLAKTTQEAIKNLDNHYQKVLILHQKMTNLLINNPHLIINSPQHDYSPYLFNFSIINLKGETTMHSLEEADIYVATTSACNANTKALDKTLMAMTNDEERTINAIRVSLSYLNTIAEVETFNQQIDKIVNNLIINNHTKKRKQ